MREYTKGRMKADVWTCDTRRLAFDALNMQICANDVRPSVVFIGDSITESFEPYAWFGKYPVVINRGISGDVTEGVLFRFDWDVIQLCPRVCVAMIGVNNTWRLDGLATELLSEKGTYEEVFDVIPGAIEQLIPCYREMAEKCRDNEIKLILCSVTPAAHDLKVGRDYRNFFIDRLNEKINAVSEEYDVDYCDFSHVLKDENGQMRADLSLDRLHPNADGYRCMVGVLKPILDKYL